MVEAIPATEPLRLPRSIRRKTWLVAGLLGVAAAGAWTLYAVNPVGAKWFPVCPFHQLTGLDCPGCGIARGLHALLHGRIAAAVDSNVLLLPLLLFLAIAFWDGLIMETRLWRTVNRPAIIMWIICGFWVLRNIPFYPFNVLSSGH